MATPFDNLNTNDFLDVTQFYNITALVIISESSIDAAGTYNQPDIISVAEIEDGAVIRSYTGNKAMLQHEYLTDIASVKALGIYYSYFSLAFLCLSALWIWLVWRKYRDEASALQRSLTLLPLLKLIHVYAYGSYVRDSPWSDQFQTRYLMMIIVTIATVYQAFLVTFLLLLSKGWKIARQTLKRSDLSNFMILMGVVYLCYSAYYVTLSIPFMLFFLNVSSVLF